MRTLFSDPYVVTILSKISFLQYKITKVNFGEVMPLKPPCCGSPCYTKKKFSFINGTVTDFPPSPSGVNIH